MPMMKVPPHKNRLMEILPSLEDAREGANWSSGNV
jgi:hypothetical protein